MEGDVGGGLQHLHLYLHVTQDAEVAVDQGLKFYQVVEGLQGPWKSHIYFFFLLWNHSECGVLCCGDDCGCVCGGGGGRSSGSRELGGRCGGEFLSSCWQELPGRLVIKVPFINIQVVRNISDRKLASTLTVSLVPGRAVWFKLDKRQNITMRNCQKLQCVITPTVKL